MSVPKKPAPEAAMHTPFSWLVPELKDDGDAQFAALVMDLCEGVATCLELVYSSDLERHGNPGAGPNAGTAPALSKPEADRLLRFAMGSSRLLAESAEQHIDWLNQREIDKRNSVTGNSP